MLAKKDLRALSLAQLGLPPDALTEDDLAAREAATAAAGGWDPISLQRRYRAKAAPGAPMTQFDAFLGHLDRQREEANANGLDVRTDLSGLAPRGRSVSLGAMGGGRPGDDDVARSWAINTALTDLGDEKRAREQSLRAMTADASLRETGAREAQRAQEAQDLMDRTLTPPIEPTDVTRTVGPTGETITARPVTPMSSRERLLAAVPGHLRPGLEKTLAEMDLKKQESDLAVRKQNEVERENKVKDVANAPFVGPVDASGAPITGPAVLQGLPETKRKVVTAVLEGRQAIPSGTALKDPYWKSIIETANLVDPNFDTVNYNARANTRKDFTGGKAAQQINAINTVVGHLHDLAATGEQLGNTGLDWVNSIYNKLTPGGTKRGVALNNFNTLKEGVATELMRTWRQVGAGSEKEIEDWKSTITAAKSPAELKGAFKTVGGMLESKLGALDSQYKQGMGTDAVSAISPESRARLDALQGVVNEKPEQRPIPGIPGGMAELRNGKWIRVK